MITIINYEFFIKLNKITEKKTSRLEHTIQYWCSADGSQYNKD